MSAGRKPEPDWEDKAAAINWLNRNYHQEPGGPSPFLQHLFYLLDNNFRTSFIEEHLNLPELRIFLKRAHHTGAVRYRAPPDVDIFYPESSPPRDPSVAGDDPEAAEPSGDNIQGIPKAFLTKEKSRQLSLENKAKSSKQRATSKKANTVNRAPSTLISSEHAQKQPKVSGSKTQSGPKGRAKALDSRNSKATVPPARQEPKRRSPAIAGSTRITRSVSRRNPSMAWFEKLE